MSNNVTIVLPDGTERRLGNNVPKAGLTKAWPTFGDTPNVKLIPRSQWPDLIANFQSGPFFPFLPPVHDQNGVGQCNADDTTALLESCRMQQGLPYIQLSAADLYAQINGGVDEGSLLEDAIHAVMTTGVGTAATSGTVWKRGVWKGEASAGERARFKLLEAFLCPTFDHCMSAVLQGFRLSSGIPWCSNYTPDSDGWLPNPGSDVGGHAILGYKPAFRNGVFGIWHQNSWGTNWGVDGRFVIREVGYGGGAIGGWWAGRAVTDEGGVVPPETP